MEDLYIIYLLYWTSTIGRLCIDLFHLENVEELSLIFHFSKYNLSQN